MSHTEEQPTTSEAAQPQGPGNWLRHVTEGIQNRRRELMLAFTIGTAAVVGAVGTFGMVKSEIGIPRSNINNTKVGATHAPSTTNPDARGNDQPSIYMPQAPSYEGGWNQKAPDQNPDAPKPRIDMQPGEDPRQ